MMVKEISTGLIANQIFKRLHGLFSVCDEVGSNSLSPCGAKQFSKRLRPRGDVGRGERVLGSCRRQCSAGNIAIEPQQPGKLIGPLPGPGQGLQNPAERAGQSSPHVGDLAARIA